MRHAAVAREADQRGGLRVVGADDAGVVARARSDRRLRGSSSTPGTGFVSPSTVFVGEIVASGPARLVIASCSAVQSEL